MPVVQALTQYPIIDWVGLQSLMHMRRTADRLFGDAYQWSVLGAGRHQTNLVTMGAILGGNVRVGLEDSIYLGRGVLAESTASPTQTVLPHTEAFEQFLAEEY
jgi:uncharacterized protein (DUF849 family)